MRPRISGSRNTRQKIEDDELARQERSKLQLDDAEGGSFDCLEQLAENTQAEILTLSEIKDSGERKQVAIKIISQQKSMATGLQAYAGIRKLNPGGKGDEGAAENNPKEPRREQPDVKRYRDLVEG